MEFIIITGMSGAGKSQAINILEDLNYYCMDNVPPALLTKFAELLKESKRENNKVAVVVDIRSGDFFTDLFKSLYDLKEMGIDYKVLFLDAKDEELIKRYKELRRPHPLNRRGSIIEGIKLERQALSEVKSRANYVIDTSNKKIKQLKDEIYNFFENENKEDNFSLVITSFGFKHGMLLDGDLIFDVRFLPNPYYITELKPKTGRDKDVKNYVLKWEQTTEFINKLIDMLEFLIPYYINEGKSQLIIGIGCTGGQHRSIAIAEELGTILSNNGYKVYVNHRDN